MLCEAAQAHETREDAMAFLDEESAQDMRAAQANALPSLPTLRPSLLGAFKPLHAVSEVGLAVPLL